MCWGGARETNYYLRTQRDKGLMKKDNFTQNPTKLRCNNLLTPKGIHKKAWLTLHFLQRKRREFEELKREIKCLCAEVVENNTVPGAAITAAPPGETYQLSTRTPVVEVT